MEVIVGLSDGDAFPYTSKYSTLEKVITDLMSKRYVIIDGVLYNLNAIVKVTPV